MRIIAGEFRGRKLLAPRSDTTRPVTDRVKQSVFDILSPMLDGAVVYDCFAGTGSMGLECLSRGATRVTFFESDKSAADLLRRNIETVGVGSRSQVVTEDLFKWFASSQNSHSLDGKTNLIFLDPPYRMLADRADHLFRLAKLFKLHHLTVDGLVVFRHDANDSLPLPPLIAADVRNYGSMTVEFLRPG